MTPKHNEEMNEMTTPDAVPDEPVPWRWRFLSDDDVQGEISGASNNPAWFDIEYGRRIEALVRSNLSLVSDEMVMAPREPTSEMIAAIPWPTSVTPRLGVECYHAMLAAAPTRPSVDEVPGMTLSPADQLKFAQALVNPPAPNEAMHAAASAHDRLIASDINQIIYVPTEANIPITQAGKH